METNQSNNQTNVDNSNAQSVPVVVSSSPSPLGPLQSQQVKPRLPLGILVLLLIFAFLGGLLLSGWYFQSQLQRISNNQLANTNSFSNPKILVIGTDATAPPMESINKQGGLVGYDIDLGYRLANEMGVKVEFRNTAWDDIFTSLVDKKIDMIISSVTITDERKQKYAFSDPYINAGEVIVSRKDAPITSTAGLKGKKISVQKGTTNEEEAMKFTDSSLVLSYDNFIDAAKAVSDGKSDATISDLTLAKGYVDQYTNLEITTDPFTNEYYGIVVRKEDPALLKKINDALSVLSVKGILTDLKQKWLD